MIPIVSYKMSKPEWVVKENPAEVALAFTHRLQQRLQGRQEAFHLALSGGSTPQLLFELWASDFADAIDWQQLHFWWGDERCVPPDDPDSNFGVAHSKFLDPCSVNPANIHRMLGEQNPSDEARRYAGELRTHLNLRNGWPAFDLVLLGMGTDGHTASLFPDRMDLWESEETCAAVKHPESGQSRVTLTGPVLNLATEVAFLVTGESKRPWVERLMAQDKSSQAPFPAAKVQPVGDLAYFLDKAAQPQNSD